VSTDELADAARVRDFLFDNGPALPHEVADACGVPVSVVTRMLREGILAEVPTPEARSCERCGAAGILDKLCPACRQRLTKGQVERPSEPLPVEASPQPVGPGRPRFHSRRAGS